MRSIQRATVALGFVLAAAASVGAQSFAGKDGSSVKDLVTARPATAFTYYVAYDEVELDSASVKNDWTVIRHEPVDLTTDTEGAKVFLSGGAPVGTTVEQAMKAAEAHAAEFRLWLEAPDGTRRRASDPLAYKDLLLMENETEVESGKRVSLGKRVSVVAKAPSGIVLKTGGPAWEMFITGLVAGVVIGLGIGLALAANRRRLDLL